MEWTTLALSGERRDLPWFSVWVCLSLHDSETFI
jgi:hypothetical protein